MQTERQQAKAMIAKVMRGANPRSVVREAMSTEDELAAIVGLGAGEVTSKLTDLGYTENVEAAQTFASGSIKVFEAPNPENPAENARVYLAIGSDGNVKSAQTDATPNRDPEALATYIKSIADQLGLTRPEGSVAQPPAGGTGVAQPQA